MKKHSSRVSVLVLSMLFLCFFIIFDWRWAAVLSLLTGILGILSSYISSFIEYGMMQLTKSIGHVVQAILLAFLFYLILLPVSKIYRIFNKDILMLSTDHSSFFIEIKKDFEKESLEKTW